MVFSAFGSDCIHAYSVATVNATEAARIQSHSNAPKIMRNLVEWAIALHGMYESALVIISILKQKNLYIVGCVQFDIWDITAYLLLPELKYHYEK